MNFEERLATMAKESNDKFQRELAEYLCRQLGKKPLLADLEALLPQMRSKEAAMIRVLIKKHA